MGSGKRWGEMAVGLEEKKNRNHCTWGRQMIRQEMEKKERKGKRGRKRIHKEDKKDSGVIRRRKRGEVFGRVYSEDK